MGTALTTTFLAWTTAALPDRGELGRLVAGGLAGLITWEMFARLLTPLVLGGPLEPAALIISLAQNLFGVSPGRLPAEAVHYLTGIVFYPLAYLALRRRCSFGSVVDGLLWGVITWVLALGVFAPAAGLPFMLGWLPLTWMSLLGHLAYGTIAVGLFHRLRWRAASSPTPAGRAARGQAEAVRQTASVA